jgi:septal ring-binding cell division protein DamX
LSTERTEKYDLLIDQITHSQQTLVLVGPDGIGKTTFFEKLRADKAEDWKIYFIQSHGRLNFDYIQKSLLASLSGRNSAMTDLALDEALAAYEELNIKVVLLIDDAGKLIPELVTDLCKLALENTDLRIVFSLTSDQLEQLNKTETSIKACRVIELPALSRWQCAKYLQSLSTNRANQIDIKQVTLAFADKIYAKTGGIPGRILSYLGDTPVIEEPATDKYVLFISCALLVGIIAYTMITGLPEIFVEKDKAAREQATVLKRDNSSRDKLDLLTGKNSQSSLNNKIITNPGDIANIQFEKAEDLKLISTEKTGQTVMLENGLEKVVVAIDEKNNTSQLQAKFADVSTDIDTTIEIEAPGKQPEPKPELVIDKQLSDHQWVLSQLDSNYTLQLIVLSNLSKTIALKKKHESSEFPITLLKIQKRSGKRYVLLSGSFADFQAAKQASKELPKQFQQPWIRKLGAVQQELEKSFKN